jgi:hypothetical protein
MTKLEWQKLEETVTQMTVQEKRRLLAIVNSALTNVEVPADDPLLGSMANEPDLVDQVVEFTLNARGHNPLRLRGNG